MTESTWGNEQTLQPLVQLKEHNIALLFANYLTTIGIEAKVISLKESLKESIKESEIESEKPSEQANTLEKNNFVVYCAAEQFEQAKAEFGEFIKQPFATKYQQAAWQHGNTVDVNVNELSLFANFKENFTSLDHSYPMI